MDFVLKLSPTGEYVWSEVLGNTTGEAWFNDLEIDSSTPCTWPDLFLRQLWIWIRVKRELV